jgi:L-amino acid N-acyltransferase YncA
MRPSDADQVLAIYQAGLDTRDASFETAAPAWDAFDQGKLPLRRHVAVAVTGEVLGWIAASTVSPRPVYPRRNPALRLCPSRRAGPWHRGRPA